MKNLIKTFAFNELLELCERKNWRLPTLKEARKNHSEYNVLWISDTPENIDDRETHALLYNKKLDIVEIVNKNHKHHVSVIKMQDKQAAATQKFIEDIFEIAFGDNAINRDFSYEDVTKTLKEFSEKSWQYEQLET